MTGASGLIWIKPCACCGKRARHPLAFGRSVLGRAVSRALPRLEPPVRFIAADAGLERALVGDEAAGLVRPKQAGAARSADRGAAGGGFAQGVAADGLAEQVGLDLQ